MILHLMDVILHDLVLTKAFRQKDPTSDKLLQEQDDGSF